MKNQLSETARAICTHCAETMRAHKLTPDERAAIKPGAFVKVSDNDEGFFVKVTQVEGDTIQGIVDNDLLLEHDFQCGDTLELDMSEVYAVLPKTK